jgi:hypothetical protein
MQKANFKMQNAKLEVAEPFLRFPGFLSLFHSFCPAEDYWKN